jgi:ferredoxin-NADP reductase
MNIEVRIRRITWEAPDVHSFELVPLTGELPAFEAGAHIDVFLPGGLVRQYSLHNAPHERHRYLISVSRRDAGRGGSRAMHQQLAVGQVISISPPRNAFALQEDASRYLLLGGGIGITPLLSMAARLDELGARYALHYCCRERENAPFVDMLAEREASAKAHIHADGGVPARGLQVDALLREATPATQVYCCGPASLMEAVRAATRHWPAGTVHFESFAPPPVNPPPRTEAHIDFEAELAKSGKVVGVAHGQTLLQALHAAGVDVESSCEAGTCGACKTRYLQGEPEHQDFVLGADEQAQYLMPCVSRCRGQRLVLDL